MKISFRAFAAGAFFFVLLLFVSIQEVPIPKVLSAENVQRPIVHIVADVNLQDCTYTQSTSADQSITITCNITNKLGNQGDVHYGIRLLKKTTESQEIIDTKVYDQVLSLSQYQTVSQKMVYIPPSYADGKYELVGFLSTSDGLLLSINDLGEITLKSSSPYLEIERNTCRIRVQGGLIPFDPNKGADIDPGEMLEVECAVKSHIPEDTTVVPSLITYKESVFGEVVSNVQDTKNPIVFKNNEEKIISFVFPEISTPQSYETIVSLRTPDGVEVSNNSAIRYTVRGISVTIQNVLLDKDYYAKGDMAKVSVFWTGSVNSLSGEGQLEINKKVTNLLLSIKDENDNYCAEEKTFTTPSNETERNKLNDYSLLIARPCMNPQSVIKIVDNEGSVLAQKTVALISKEIPKEDPIPASSPTPKNSIAARQAATYIAMVFFSVLVLVVAGGYVYKNWKKNI